MSEAAEAADDLKKLGDAAEAAGKKLEESAKAAGLTGEKLDKLKELAIGALGGEETVEKYNKAKSAIKLAGDSSASTGQRMLAGAAAAKFAAGAASTLVSSMIDLIRETDKSSATLYEHDQRAHALSASMGALRTATAGAADTQVAFNMQFALAERGMAATAEQQATLARATREYAQVRQVSQEQASAALQRALDGDAQAAAQFGISLNGANTAATRQAAVLAGLEQQHRGVTAAQRDAVEIARQREKAEEIAMARGTAGAGRAIQNVTLLGVAYRWAVDRTQQQIEATERLAKTNDMHGASIRRTVTTVREIQALEEARVQDAARAATAQQNAAALELQQLGERVSGVGRVVSAQEQYAQALAAVNTIQRRAGEEQPAFEQRRLEATNNLIAAVRRKKEEQDRADNTARATAELGMLAAQIRAHGGVVDARIRSITPAERYRDIQREIAGFAQRENESAADSQARLMAMVQAAESARQASIQQGQEARQRIREQDELVRAGRELREEVEWAQREGVRVAEVERRRFETGAEYIARRIEAQRALNEVVLEGMEASDRQRDADAATLRRKADERVFAEAERQRQLAEREEDAAFERDRQRAAMNAAAMERERADETQNRLREAFGFAQEQSNTVTQSMASGAKAAYDGFGELGKGIVEATLAATAAGEDVGAAVAQQVDQWATAKAVQWGLQAGESLAGAGLAYFIRPDAVPGLLASAATYAGMAAVAGVTAAVIPNAPAASAGGAGGGADRGLGLAASSRATSADAKMQPNIVVNVSGVMSNEQTQHEIARSLRDLRDRGMM